MRCDKCLAPAFITDWRPDKGLDPYLAEFKCSKCGRRVYKCIPSRERNASLKRRQAAEQMAVLVEEVER